MASALALLEKAGGNKGWFQYLDVDPGPAAAVAEPGAAGARGSAVRRALQEDQGQLLLRAASADMPSQESGEGCGAGWVLVAGALACWQQARWGSRC
jgi:hypothetical protein